MKGKGPEISTLDNSTWFESGFIPESAIHDCIFSGATFADSKKGAAVTLSTRKKDEKNIRNLDFL